MSKLVNNQIQKAETLTSLMNEDFDSNISVADLLECLAKLGLILTLTPKSPTYPKITLISHAYFTSIGAVEKEQN
jgi:hypothetical protein